MAITPLVFCFQNRVIIVVYITRMESNNYTSVVKLLSCDHKKLHYYFLTLIFRKKNKFIAFTWMSQIVNFDNMDMKKAK
jgi:hypothetical protein